MATTAIVYQYANASTSQNGFVMDLQVILRDPVTGNRMAGNILAVEIVDGDVTTADATIKTAVQSYAVAMGFAQPALNRILMPKFTT